MIHLKKEINGEQSYVILIPKRKKKLHSFENW